MSRNIYLDMLSVDEAVSKVQASLDRDKLVKIEKVASYAAKYRVLAEPVYAKYSSPLNNVAAMDGYAIRASDTYQARAGQPIELTIAEACYAVNTGNLLNNIVDAVIMIEQVEELGDKIRIESPAYPYQHIRRAGEDIVATELLFPKLHKLSASDVAALLSGGIREVEVYERIRVQVIPTGDEILDFMSGAEPKANQVIESNSQMLVLLAEDLHCEAKRIPPIQDQAEALHQALVDSLEAGNHITIFCAGSSAGTKDFTKSTIAKEGEILVHGVKIMPGKPSILANCKNKLVVGSPGYPVSALVCFEKLISPIIEWLTHSPSTELTTIPVEMAKKCPSKLGLEEIVRLSVAKLGNRYVASPLNRGAGNITTVTKSQAYMSIAVNSEGINEGQVVQAVLTVPKSQLDCSIICVGSHDNVLDLIKNELTAANLYLSSSHVGSTGGITALRNKACHFAGMHLLDPETQDYNFPFLEKSLPDLDLCVVNLVLREQGLIVQKNNPKNIRSIQDIVQHKHTFLNRQLGSGTRILFDQKLTELKLSAKDINGYDKVEYTHMAVAINVLNGLCDVSMGIQAAAKALDLDFVPLTNERYDLVIPQEYLALESIQALLSLIRSDDFKQKVQALGGYDTSLTGQIMSQANASASVTLDPVIKNDSLCL